MLKIYVRIPETIINVCMVFKNKSKYQLFNKVNGVLVFAYIKYPFEIYNLVKQMHQLFFQVFKNHHVDYSVFKKKQLKK